MENTMPRDTNDTLRSLGKPGTSFGLTIEVAESGMWYAQSNAIHGLLVAANDMHTLFKETADVLAAMSQVAIDAHEKDADE
jgi:hypothetical protein